MTQQQNSTLYAIVRYEPADGTLRFCKAPGAASYPSNAPTALTLSEARRIKDDLTDKFPRERYSIYKLVSAK